jgi:hypothetical protein
VRVDVDASVAARVTRFGVVAERVIVVFCGETRADTVFCAERTILFFEEEVLETIERFEVFVFERFVV